MSTFEISLLVILGTGLFLVVTTLCDLYSALRDAIHLLEKWEK